MKKLAVNWHNEQLDKFYEDDNDGFIHGIYYLDNDDQVEEVSWFKTITEQTKEMEA